jgi:REP element-mobilizing transposase RayT
MGYDPELRHRHSIRLKDYDYSAGGAYYVTICTDAKQHTLGEVTDGEMHTNACGLIVMETWQWLGVQYDYVYPDAFIVMPNHTHGVIITAETLSSGSQIDHVKKKPLGQLVGVFKTVTTKRINELRGTPGAVFWQRNYYEHVIRSQRALDEIREYIGGNPWNWPSDWCNANRTKRSDTPEWLR